MYCHICSSLRGSISLGSQKKKSCLVCIFEDHLPNQCQVDGDRKELSECRASRLCLKNGMRYESSTTESRESQLSRLLPRAQCSQ